MNALTSFLIRAGKAIWSAAKAFAIGSVTKVPLLTAATVICVFALPGGEFFPFSSFPMYSRNKRKTFIVYLKDGQGNPIAAEKSLGVRSSVLKKDYNRQLSKLKAKLGISDYAMTVDQKRPAAENSLKYLIEERSPERLRALGIKQVQLVDVRIERDKGKIVKNEQVIAAMPVQP